MRFSELLIPTLKEEPKDAELPSHRLMLRAGLVRSLSAGIYTYLPLGWRVLGKIEEILRQEMNAIGGQEVRMPVVQPAELWQESGRWYEYGPELVRFRDRAKRDLVLAMTHEEAVSALVRREIRTYRQLPLMLYQIQTKFRDEPRPRGGLIRVREFTMKDAYSFHANDESLDAYYPAVGQAYAKIFQRCSVDAAVIEGDPGLIGGRESHEFILPNERGEDLFVRCAQCGYSANVELAAVRRAAGDSDAALAPLAQVGTPDSASIEAVARYLGVPTSKTAKAVFYKTENQEIVLAVVRGDLHVNEGKLARVVASRGLTAATEDEIRAVGSVPGYASAVGLTPRLGPGVRALRVVADSSIALERNLVAGANVEGFHLTGVNYERDFRADLVADIAIAREGDLCGRCGAPLQMQKGIELGHIFKLGTRYSQAMGALFVDQDGQEKPLVMGCYGIGVGRLLAAVIEAHHDERGIVWPVTLAPYAVVILVLNPDEADQRRVAEGLDRALAAAHIDALVDERAESSGFKFKDADLLGFPVQVVIGPRGLRAGTVDIQRRADGQRQSISITDGLTDVVRSIERWFGA